MLKKSLLFVGLLFVSPIFADDLEYDYVSQKVKPDYIQPFKRFEFRFGVGYDINFSTYNNKKSIITIRRFQVLIECLAS